MRKSKNGEDPQADAAAALAKFRVIGMLIALGAAARSGYQAAATSDLLAGAIRAAEVWALVAGTVLVGSTVMGAIIAATPPDSTVTDSTQAAEPAQQ